MIKTERTMTSTGMIKYCIEGTDIYHREDGPAVITVSGSEYWYQHGKLHCLDGPAVKHENDYKAWWYQGKKIIVNNQKDFEQYIKLIAFE